ncbi:MAG: CBS domain-containing protein [Arcobacteraceae bacterium]|nr:CBS domain-containing protein [Arcobacteraceae bacterium]
MFAMYDDYGLNFRSTLDRLYDLQHVTASKPIKDALDDKNNQSFEEQLYKGKITKQAKDKYKQMTNLDTRIEIHHIEQIMSSNIITVEDSISIKECYDLMIEHNIEQLPISADNALHLKGLITKNAILDYLVTDISYAKKNIYKTIHEISTKKIITTDPISDIRRVAKVMIDFNIHSIPVVNSEDILVGIVSQNDMTRAISSIPHIQIFA